MRRGDDRLEGAGDRWLTTTQPGYVSLPPYTVYMVNLDGDDRHAPADHARCCRGGAEAGAHLEGDARCGMPGQTVLVHTQAGHTDATDEMLNNLSAIADGRDEEADDRRFELDVRTRRTLIDHGVK